MTPAAPVSSAAATSTLAASAEAETTDAEWQHFLVKSCGFPAARARAISRRLKGCGVAGRIDISALDLKTTWTGARAAL